MAMQVDLSNAQVIKDDQGRPFIVVRDQGRKKQQHGNDAVKAHIVAARTVANIVRTSLVRDFCYGDATSTNRAGPTRTRQDPDLAGWRHHRHKRWRDHLVPGADILGASSVLTLQMEISNHVAKLLVELSRSQDDEIGDGTTGVVVLAGALLEKAADLIDKGIHPIRIADGYEQACELAVAELDRISDTIEFSKEHTENLVKVAKTSLGSKM